LNCTREGCDRPAVWEPCLVIYAIGHPDAPPARGRCIGLGVCDEHRKTLTVDDLVTPAGWSMISDKFAEVGVAEPDRGKVEVEFNRLRSEEPGP
jgi:hypothetical protein